MEMLPWANVLNHTHVLPHRFCSVCVLCGSYPTCSRIVSGTRKEPKSLLQRLMLLFCLLLKGGTFAGVGERNCILSYRIAACTNYATSIPWQPRDFSRPLSLYFICLGENALL